MSRDVVPAGMVSFNASLFMLFNACVALCALGDLQTIWQPPPFRRTEGGVDSTFTCLWLREWPAAVKQLSSDVPAPTEPAPAVTEGWSLEAMDWWLLRPGRLDPSELWALTYIPVGLVGTHNLDFSYSSKKHNDIWSAPAPVCALLTCQKLSDKLESTELCVSYQLLVLRVLLLDLQYHWITAWICSCITYTNHKYLGCVLQSARKWAEISPAAFTPLSTGISFQSLFLLRPDWNQWPRSKILCILLSRSPWSCAI